MPLYLKDESDESTQGIFSNFWKKLLATIGYGTKSTLKYGTLGVLGTGLSPALITGAVLYGLYKSPDYLIKSRRMDAANKKAVENQEINQYIRALDFFVFNLRRSMLGKEVFKRDNTTSIKNALNACSAWIKITRKKPILESLYKQKLEEFEKNNDLDNYAKWAKYSIGFSASRTKGQEEQNWFNRFTKDKDRDEIKNIICSESMLYYQDYIETLETVIFLYKLVHYKYSTFLIKKRCILSQGEHINASNTQKNLFQTKRWNDSELIKTNEYFNQFKNKLEEIRTNIVNNSDIVEKNIKENARLKYGYINNDDTIRLILEGMPSRLMDNEVDCKLVKNSTWYDSYENLVLQQQIPDVALVEFLDEGNNEGKFNIKGLREFKEFQTCKDENGKIIQDVEGIDKYFKRLELYVDKLKNIRTNQRYILDSLSEIINEMVDWIEKKADSDSELNKTDNKNQYQSQNKFSYADTKLADLMNKFIFIEKYVSPDELNNIKNKLIDIVFKTEEFKNYKGNTTYFGKDQKPLKRKSIIQIEKDIYDFTNELLIQKVGAPEGKLDIGIEYGKKELDKRIQSSMNRCANVRENINRPWALDWKEKYIPLYSLLNKRKSKLTEEILQKGFEEYKQNKGTSHPLGLWQTTMTTINDIKYYLLVNGEYKLATNINDDNKQLYASMGKLYKKEDDKYVLVSKYEKQKDIDNRLIESFNKTQEIKGDISTVNNTISNLTNQITMNVGDDSDITEAQAAYYAQNIYDYIPAHVIKWGKDLALKGFKWSDTLKKMGIENPYDLLFYLVNKKGSIKTNTIILEKDINLIDSKNELKTIIEVHATNIKGAILKNNDLAKQIFYSDYNEKINISNPIINSWIDYYVETQILNNSNYFIFILINYFFGEYSNSYKTELQLGDVSRRELKIYENELNRIEDEFLNKINSYIKKRQLTKYDNVNNLRNQIDKNFLIEKIYLKRIINIGHEYALKLKTPISNMYSKGDNNKFIFNPLKEVIDKMNPGLNKIKDYNQFYKPNGFILPKDDTNKLYNYIKDNNNLFELKNTVFPKNVPELKIQSLDFLYYQVRLAITQWNKSVTEGYSLYGDDIKNAKDKNEKIAEKYYEHKDDPIEGTNFTFGYIVIDLLREKSAYWKYVDNTNPLIASQFNAPDTDFDALGRIPTYSGSNIPLKARVLIAKALHDDFKKVSGSNNNPTKKSNGETENHQKLVTVGNTILKKLTSLSTGTTSFYQSDEEKQENKNTNSNKKQNQNNQNQNQKKNK
jgi:hypothetical protein